LLTRGALSLQEGATLDPGGAHSWNRGPRGRASGAPPPPPPPPPRARRLLTLSSPRKTKTKTTKQQKQRAQFLPQCEALIAGGRVEELVDRLTAKLPAVYAAAPAAGDKGEAASAFFPGTLAAPPFSAPPFFPASAARVSFPLAHAKTNIQTKH